MAAAGRLSPRGAVSVQRLASVAAAAELLAADAAPSWVLAVVALEPGEAAKALQLCGSLRRRSGVRPYVILRGTLEEISAAELDAADVDLVVTRDHVDAGTWDALVNAGLRRADAAARPAASTSPQEEAQRQRFETIARMVSGVAHEVYTPLGVASTASSMLPRLFAQLVQQVDAGADRSETLRDLHELVASLRRNVSRAHELMKAFKQVTSSQVSNRRAKVDLQALLGDCVLIMAPELRQRHIEVTVEAAPGLTTTWDGYPGELTQVIINLFQNTIRYGYPDAKSGAIHIRILPGASAPEHLRIEYQDHGRGIAPEVLRKLFQRFVTTGADRGGTGLGLAVSRDIITELLRGQISCQSELGKGATFILEIPRSVPRAAEGG